MNAKANIASQRKLFLYGGQLSILLWGYQEMERQIEEGQREYLAVYKGESIKECTCGCGLKNGICETRQMAVRAINDEIPF